MNTGVYDKQAKAVINKKLRDVDKRLSAYCMQVVSGGDADSLAGEFASDVGASIEDGETQVSVTASDMGHAMSEEARKKIHYSPDADLIATLSAASLQSYRSWEDRTSAGDVLKGFAAQTKDAVSLLPSGTNAERAARLAEYLKKPATIVADSEGSAVRPQKALFSNLRRLVVSDIATAYRVVEKRIWNALPFVVGYEVLLGDNHRKIDMCDDLQGIYPKDFDFFGWHPWCRCFARPIFSWESEKVTEMPENFNTWIEDNKERIEKARERGTLPRWIKDNPKYVDGVLNISIEMPEELSFRTDREAFNALRRSYRNDMLARERIEISSPNIYSHRLFYGNNEKRNVLTHAFTQSELEACRHLQDLLPSISGGKYIPIDMSRPNYREKMQRFGVRNFVGYEIMIDGDCFILKCEAKYHRGKIVEFPYSLKKKRSQ